MHGTRPECRLGSGHTRSPNSLWSLSTAACYRGETGFQVTIEGPCPVQPGASCAAGGSLDGTAVSYLTEQPPACQATARRVPAAADDDGAAAKVCSPALRQAGTTSSYRTASILSDTLQPAPAFYRSCSPSLPAADPRISAHGARFPPQSRPAASLRISGFPGPDRLVD